MHLWLDETEQNGMVFAECIFPLCLSANFEEVAWGSIHGLEVKRRMELLNMCAWEKFFSAVSQIVCKAMQIKIIEHPCRACFDRN